MDKDSNFIEYIAPNIAAKKIGVAPTTLRKYSSLIENLSGNLNYFERDSNNSRLYSRNDVATIKRVISLKKRPNISLKSALKQALEENDIASVSDTDSQLGSDTSTDTTAELQLASDDKIKQYETLINQLVESNLKLSDQLETAIKRIEKHDKNLLELETTSINKKGFFSRFFNKKK